MNSAIVAGEARREHCIWKIEITALDLIESPFFAFAVDMRTRLIVASAVFQNPGDIVAMLDEACTLSGCPDEIWIDKVFNFSSSSVKEWGAQRTVEVVWGPPFPQENSTPDMS
jgi:hypothetical protein